MLGIRRDNKIIVAGGNNGGNVSLPVGYQGIHMSV